MAMDAVPDTVAELVEPAVEGDREAISELLTRLRPRVVRYCRARIGRSPETYSSADDVAQEVLLAVFTALPRYAGSGSGFLPFVYGIASHKVTDAYRRRAQDRTRLEAGPHDMPDSTAGPEQRALQSELSGRLSLLLETLTPHQREVLRLRLLVGLTVTETAYAVSGSPGAVRVAQHRALANLRTTLEGSEHALL